MRPLVMVLALVAGCGAAPLAAGSPAPDAPSTAARARILALCETSCEAQAQGHGCSSEDYLPWCLNTCETLQGMLPDDCLDEAEEAMACWAEETWYCDGATAWSGADQPLPTDAQACAEVTIDFYDCA